MDPFYERLLIRAAAIDEILSDNFEVLPGGKNDAELSARRLAAWCRSSSSGDWSLFSRRLALDGLSIEQVLNRFADIRRRPSAPTPQWIDDAIWIERALTHPHKPLGESEGPDHFRPCAFVDLYTPVVECAETLVWQGISRQARDNLNESALACLRHFLLEQLSDLCAPAIYSRFKSTRSAAKSDNSIEPKGNSGTLQYDRFVAEMKGGGFRRLFEDKPVLLRLVASLTRQWIDATCEFVERLDADLPIIRQIILQSSHHSRISRIQGGLSDPHNGGRSVWVVTFDNGTRVVYKPKDLRLDAAWHRLVDQLNQADPPVALKAMRAIPRDGYGWTEFIDHASCLDPAEFKQFFQRAGAWLSLFHCFAATDMHQENLIAMGGHPVPIDLEMILQSNFGEQKASDVEGEALNVAVETMANSVSTVGLIPTYGRSPDNSVYAVGGMTSNRASRIKLGWSNINSDTMQPRKWTEVDHTFDNLPHLEGRYAKFADFVDDFVSGFESYSRFLLHYTSGGTSKTLFDGFDGLPVRKTIRPTRFYYMLIQRLRDHRTMDDGVAWSAQADFMARLLDWDKESDAIWRLHCAERLALVGLNYPHFVSHSDGREIFDSTGISLQTDATSGLDRARARVRSFDLQDIAWQTFVIRQNTNSVAETLALNSVSQARRLLPDASSFPERENFLKEADKIAREIISRAIRRGPGAAWIGVDWVGESEFSQLRALGFDLYNGMSGIALFLAAYAKLTGNEEAREVALAGMAAVRKKLRGQNAARMARFLGIGGANGLGSIVYALSVISQCLRDEELLADAHIAAGHFTDELIGADKLLDVVGGSAGGILGLLRLYRDTKSDKVLNRASKCGEHLLGHPRFGVEGRRTWVGQGSGSQALNGISHGAAGFAYALASLSAATGRDEFASAALECLAFENSSYDAGHSNWPGFREGAPPAWPCRWCHGASGIGLARIAIARQSGSASQWIKTDIENALNGAERGWPNEVDTLCCGTLGNIEFLCEAGNALQRSDVMDLASRRLTAVLEAAGSAGDYRWNTGDRKFNLGLFRGLAGVGYTCLRRVEPRLPNVLIWE